MTKNELAVTYEADGGEITLNPNIVLRYMVDDSTMANISDKEMAKVIMTCKARKLNPFTGDVIVQPHRNNDGSVTCSLVTTKNFFERRAQHNPRYRGKKSGVCVLSSDGRPVKRQGSAVYKDLGERLMGGWCEVYVEGYEVPEYAEVSLDEYDQHRALWKTKPGTMIAKTAISQALRSAFPDDFSNVYEPEEMGVDTDEEGDPVQAAEEPAQAAVEAVETVYEEPDLQPAVETEEGTVYFDPVSGTFK